MKLGRAFNMIGGVRLAVALALMGLSQAVAAPQGRDCPDCPEMATLPASIVTIGSTKAETDREHVDPALAAREQPQRTITLPKPFAIGRYTVTRGEFARFAAATGFTPAGGCSHLEDGASNRWGMDPARNWQSPGFPQTDRDPVVCVSWNDANAYAAWLSKKTGKRYRLPTGSEWEYAARAGAATARWWGDGLEEACAHANVSDQSKAKAVGLAEAAMSCSDGYPFTSPVGSFRANAFGLYDMLGNVSQWTSDCLVASLADAPADGGAILAGDCLSHIDRGGSWTNSPRYLRLASRHSDLNDARNTVLGFRVLRESR